MSNPSLTAVFSALTLLLSESALAATLELSTNRFDNAPYSTYANGSDQKRSRYDLGSSWSGGSATLTVTVSWSDMPYSTTSIPVGVGMASSANNAFMTPTPYSVGIFETNTLSNDTLGGFLAVNNVTNLPSSNVTADLANKTLTFNFNPVLQAGTHYYLFMEYWNPMLPTALPTTITLSQVPLPASGWLLISGLAGLATASRRRKGFSAP